MTRKEFKDFVEFRCKGMIDLLDKKGYEYAAGDDGMYNFNEGVNISTCKTPEEYAWNLRTKHLQSVKDLVTRRIIPNQAGIDEKLGDDILYGFIIWAITTENNTKNHQIKEL